MTADFDAEGRPRAAALRRAPRPGGDDPPCSTWIWPASAEDAARVHGLTPDVWQFRLLKAVEVWSWRELAELGIPVPHAEQIPSYALGEDFVDVYVPEPLRPSLDVIVATVAHYLIGLPYARRYDLVAPDHRRSFRCFIPRTRKGRPHG